MRLFIAVELNPLVREKLLGLLPDLKNLKAEVKWVAMENLHLTLKFLGEVPPSQLNLISRALKSAGQPFAPFKINFAGLGAFPSLKAPRVFCLHGNAPESLLALQKLIETNLEKLGFPAEGRDFSPHITLGRVKGKKGLPEVIQKIAALLKFSAGVVKVADFALIESKLFPMGPVYTVLERFQLTGG